MKQSIHFITELHLANAPGDPRAYITRQSLDIAANGVLWIHTNGIKAIPYGIPFPTALDSSWYRRDLHIRFVGDPESVASWQRAANFIRGGF
jgi:hypothetical protein